MFTVTDEPGGGEYELDHRRAHGPRRRPHRDADDPDGRPPAAGGLRPGQVGLGRLLRTHGRAPDLGRLCPAGDTLCQRCPSAPRTKGIQMGEGAGSESSHPKRIGAKDDQTTSDADQTTSDADQTRSDSDQAGSDSDQIGSDADQLAADRDQVTADRLLEGATDLAGARDRDLSRADRDAAKKRPGRRVFRARGRQHGPRQAGGRDATSPRIGETSSPTSETSGTRLGPARPCPWSTTPARRARGCAPPWRRQRRPVKLPRLRGLALPRTAGGPPSTVITPPPTASALRSNSSARISTSSQGRIAGAWG